MAPKKKNGQEKGPQGTYARQKKKDEKKTANRDETNYAGRPVFFPKRKKHRERLNRARCHTKRATLDLVIVTKAIGTDIAIIAAITYAARSFLVLPPPYWLL